MPGLRIMHPTLRSETLLLPHPGDPRTGRRGKDYHLRLNGDGEVIVSETVWQRIQEAEAAGEWEQRFVLLNEVANPPAQILGPATPLGPSFVERTTRQEPGPEGVLRDATEEQMDKIRKAIEASAPPGLAARIVEMNIARRDGDPV